MGTVKAGLRALRSAAGCPVGTVAQAVGPHRALGGAGRLLTELRALPTRGACAQMLAQALQRLPEDRGNGLAQHPAAAAAARPECPPPALRSAGGRLESIPAWLPATGTHRRFESLTAVVRSAGDGRRPAAWTDPRFAAIAEGIPPRTACDAVSGSSAWASRSATHRAALRASVAARAAKGSAAARANVAMSPNCPRGLLLRLFGDPDAMVRGAAAYNSAGGPWLTAVAAVDGDAGVRGSAAANANCSQRGLRRLAQDPAEGARLGVPAHPSCPPDVLGDLTADTAWTVADLAVKHPDCPRHILDRWVAEGTVAQRASVALRPACTAEMLAEIACSRRGGSVALRRGACSVPV